MNEARVSWIPPLIEGWRHRLDWHRMRELVRLITRSRSCQAGSIELCYPPSTWYEEHAPEMLALLGETASRLEREFGVPMPPTACYTVDPETAIEIQGATGLAYRTMTIIGFPERHLFEFAGVAAHELTHLLAHRLGKYQSPFKGEGIACYGAWRVRAQERPCGLPVHHHLAWMLSVGIKPSLAELWHRCDYTAELYDLAWSFAAFLVQRFGRDRYLDFYRSDRMSFRDQVDETLGVPLAALEKEWYDHARSCVSVESLQSSRMRRHAGAICSRAAWLAKQ